MIYFLDINELHNFVACSCRGVSLNICTYKLHTHTHRTAPTQTCMNVCMCIVHEGMYEHIQFNFLKCCIYYFLIALATTSTSTPVTTTTTTSSLELVRKSQQLNKRAHTYAYTRSHTEKQTDSNTGIQTKADKYRNRTCV